MLVGYLFFFVAALDSRLPQNEMQVAMIFKLIAPSAKDNAQRLRMHAQKNAVLFFLKWQS
jgi:protoheme ferro-lyase